MNKKMTAIGVSIAVGVTLLATTAFATVSSTSGYDAYKSAIKNFMTVKNVTSNINVTVKDNENTVVSYSTDMKIDKDNMSMSKATTISSGGQNKTTNTYLEDGKTITKSSDSDVYTVIAMNPNKKQIGKMVNAAPNDTRVKAIENVADAVVGNIQNYVKLDNPGTNDDVSLKLSNDQVPAVVNALANLVEQTKLNANEKGIRKPLGQGMNITDKLPKLVDNIKISNVDLNAKIDNNNQMSSQDVTINVTGNDASGVSHTISIIVNAAFTDYNSTTPDKIDLTGKQVKEIQPKAIGELKGSK
jgi:hypothetical protein